MRDGRRSGKWSIPFVATGFNFLYLFASIIHSAALFGSLRKV